MAGGREGSAGVGLGGSAGPGRSWWGGRYPGAAPPRRHPSPPAGDPGRVFPQRLRGAGGRKTRSGAAGGPGLRRCSRCGQGMEGPSSGSAPHRDALTRGGRGDRGLPRAPPPSFPGDSLRWPGPRSETWSGGGGREWGGRGGMNHSPRLAEAGGGAGGGWRGGGALTAAAPPGGGGGQLAGRSPRRIQLPRSCVGIVCRGGGHGPPCRPLPTHSPARPSCRCLSLSVRLSGAATVPPRLNTLPP